MKKTHNDCLAPEDKEKVGLADIFRRYADDYRRSHAVSYEQLKVMHHIEICRTAVLGGHVEQCDQCAFEQIAYNSCRDRHCPKCQTLTKEQWLNDRKAELLLMIANMEPNDDRLNGATCRPRKTGLERGAVSGVFRGLGKC